MANKVKKEEEKETPITPESPIKRGMSDTTKGLIVGVLVTALVATLIILLILGKNDANSGTSTNGGTNLVAPEDYSDAMKEFYEYFESDEKTLIVFASSQCGYCVAQKPIVEAIAEEYGIKYLYMDYLELGSNDEIDQVISELKLSSGSTPTSVVVQKGEVIKTWVGFVDGKTYVENLVSAGMLPSGTEYTLEENITSVDYSKFKSLLKGSKVSAILVDMPTCAVCYNERLALNELADKYNLTVYELSSASLEDDEMDAFIDGLGDWGYTTDEYKEDKSVQVPLLLFVKNGKIVKFNVGYVEGETNLESLFKNVGFIK